MTLRIDLDNGARLGPGKAEMLARIDSEGSIRAAGAAMGMSYRRAWLLCDEINRMFRTPAILTQHGGKAGGGAVLSAFGRDLLACCRRLEAKAAQALSEELAFLAAAAAPAPVRDES